MNKEILNGLLAYLSELQRLQASGYTCHREISECLGAIKAEFAKANVNLPADIVPAKNTLPDPKELAKYIAREIQASDDITNKEALDLLSLVSDSKTEVDGN